MKLALSILLFKLNSIFLCLGLSQFFKFFKFRRIPENKVYISFFFSRIQIYKMRNNEHFCQTNGINGNIYIYYISTSFLVEF